MRSSLQKIVEAPWFEKNGSYPDRDKRDHAGDGDQRELDGTVRDSAESDRHRNLVGLCP